MFGEAGEQQEEYRLRQTDEQILDRVNRQPAQVLEGEEGREAQNDE